SRERYWGTPLNIWTCAACGQQDAVGSIDELRERALSFPADDAQLDLHRPYVDEIELQCACGGSMRRVKDVIDVWFDSGAMPFAQYHHPWDESGMFQTQFPADYICEGIDQSRGWFYSLLAISVFLTGQSPYRNCLTTELILDKHGQKMSKSKGNTVEPWDILNDDGADALRWYLITTSPPWSPTRFDRDGVKDTARKMLENLRNVYAFFAMYATVDGYRHGSDAGAATLLDRWILSRYHTMVAHVTQCMDEYDVTRAARSLERFVLDEVSNWYVRRSRRRFWKGTAGPDKTAAYHTLYTVLDGVSHLLAPLVPYLAEELYLALRGKTAQHSTDVSVHLEDFPKVHQAAIDAELEATMEVALEVTSLGRTVRNDTGVRVRQPLARVLVHSTDAKRLDRFFSNHEVVALVKDELNVRSIERVDHLERFVTLAAAPNFPVLGKKYGKRVPAIADAIKRLDTASLLRFGEKGATALTPADSGDPVTLAREDATVAVTAVAGFGAREERGLTVIADLAIDDDLKLEGDAREVINRLQNLRKQSGLDVTDRIRLRYDGGTHVQRVFESQGGLIADETLAREVARGPADWSGRAQFELDGEPVTVWLEKSD
ncbi:MAG TPA: class I tRNA ligase family protein, partial [Candidatus Krumholzibacteria bacterium]|nr:class I tRNA ligase family protein [Candidatus Krumholzibacteria bacterium]